MSVIEVNLRGSLLIVFFRAWSGFQRGWRRGGRRGALGPAAWGSRGTRPRGGPTTAIRPRGARGATTVRGGPNTPVRPMVSLVSRGGVGASSRTGRGPTVRTAASSGGSSGGSSGRRTGAGRAAPVAASSDSGQSANPVVVLDP